MTPEEHEKLVERFAAGDEDALSQLVSVHKQPLFGFILRYIHDRTESEALLFECFVRAWRNRANYRASAQFQTWLFTIAVNLCRDHARTRRRRPGDFAVSAFEFSAERDGGLSETDPSADAALHEETEALRQEIDALPHDQKTALVLFALEGWSQEQIAEMLGCSIKAVETRIYHARQELRRRMSERD